MSKKHNAEYMAKYLELMAAGHREGMEAVPQGNIVLAKSTVFAVQQLCGFDALEIRRTLLALGVESVSALASIARELINEDEAKKIVTEHLQSLSATLELNQSWRKVRISVVFED